LIPVARISLLGTELATTTAKEAAKGRAEAVLAEPRLIHKIVEHLRNKANRERAPPQPSP